jgi:hypothetical protein
MSTARLLATCATLASLALGCQESRSNAPFDSLDFSNVSYAPGVVDLRPNEVQMERGMAVRARVSAIGTDGDPLDLLSLESTDTSVFSVDLGPELGEYVFYGTTSGQADLIVYSDRDEVGRVPVEIVDQTP